MGAFTIGSIILVPFPFSDLSEAKLRPAIVLGSAGRGDLILCQITSNSYSDCLAIKITDKSLSSGSLQMISYVRPGKLFTCHETLIKREVAILKPNPLEKVVTQVKNLIGKNK